MTTIPDHLSSQNNASLYIGSSQFLTEYGALIHQIASRFASNKADADDIYQEALYRILTKANLFDPALANGNLSGWLYRITKNIALRWLQKNANQPSSYDEPPYEWSSDSETPLDRIGHDHIMENIDNLPFFQREVFTLYCIEGYRHKEIATILNIEVSTSKTYLYKAKQKLRVLTKTETMRAA